IQRGDFITEIDGNPVGKHNRLSIALRGTPVKRIVDVALQRRRDLLKRADARGDYKEVRLRVELGDYEDLVRHEEVRQERAAIGGILLSNATSQGAVV